MARNRVGIAIVAAVLGAGAALGAAACGEDRVGDVQFEDSTTGGTTGTTGTTGTEGTVTAIATVTTPPATTPTDTDGNGGATAPDTSGGSGGATAPEGDSTVEAEP